MIKGYLVVNKETPVQDFLVRRSIMDVKAERRSLSELDIQHLEIIDVDKFLYIYYAGEDTELSFRADLNMFRQLLDSPFFHADESMFLLVDCNSANSDDLIKAAARNGRDKTKLRIIHHTGTLTLSDVSQYVIGSVIGSTAVTSYKDVYIREADKEERERFDPVGGDIREIIPELTDMYTNYQQKVAVEAGRIINRETYRPAVVNDFSPVKVPQEHMMSSFIVYCAKYSSGENTAQFLSMYLNRAGERTLIVDLRSNRNVQPVEVEDSIQRPITSLGKTMLTEAHNIVVSIDYAQFGAVIESLNNFSIVENMILLTDDLAQFDNLKRFIAPVSVSIVTSYVTHFTAECINEFLALDADVVSLLLNKGKMCDGVDIHAYEEQLKPYAVSLFPEYSVDPVDFYKCVTGRWD